MGDENSLDRILGCRTAQLPIKYLGTPLGARYKDKQTWEPVVEMSENRFATWNTNFLSKGGRYTLIKTLTFSFTILPL